MKKPQVAIVMGSDSDWSLVKSAVETLDGFGVAHDVRVISAHRTPDIAATFARGPVNAAILAVQMLAISNSGLGKKLARYKTSLKTKVAKGNARVRADVRKSS